MVFGFITKYKLYFGHYLIQNYRESTNYQIPIHGYFQHKSKH